MPTAGQDQDTFDADAGEDDVDAVGGPASDAGGDQHSQYIQASYTRGSYESETIYEENVFMSCPEFCDFFEKAVCNDESNLCRDPTDEEKKDICDEVGSGSCHEALTTAKLSKETESLMHCHPGRNFGAYDDGSRPIISEIECT